MTVVTQEEIIATGAVSGDDQIKRPVLAALLVAEMTQVRRHLDHAGTGMQLAAWLPGRIEQLEQGPTLHAQPVQTPVQLLVADVHHRFAAGRLAKQPADDRTMLQCLVQQPHPPQHLQPAGLQQEARAHRAGLGRLLEHLHIDTGTAEQYRQGLSSSAITDDGHIAYRHGLPLNDHQPKKTPPVARRGCLVKPNWISRSR